MQILKLFGQLRFRRRKIFETLVISSLQIFIQLPFWFLTAFLIRKEKYVEMTKKPEHL